MRRYNYHEHGEGQELIIEYLKQRPKEEFCALCLIDLDDFRKINSRYGYQAGDKVLDRFLQALETITLEGDILVRFGSDEFVMFFTNTTVDSINLRITKLYDKLKIVGMELGIEIECSIGIAGTESAGEYIDLYRYADNTMQHIKKYGKNNVAWYVEFDNEIGKDFKEEDASTGTRDIRDITSISIAGGGIERDLISFAFELFERTERLEDALQILIEKIGVAYELDDIKLIFMNPESMTTSVSLSWYRSPDMVQTEQIEYIPSEEELDNFMACFREEGFFTDEDFDFEKMPPETVETITRIYKKRFLNQGIFEGGIYKGAICFESDDADYQFTEEKLVGLKALSKIIAINMLKLRAETANEAKMTFISKMSHDIRTPMNAIIGMTNIAMNVIDDKQRLMECLKKIDSSTKYLLSLVNEILDISKIESGKMTVNEEPLNLLGLINDAENLFRTQAEEKHIDFVVRVDIKDNYVFGDSTKLNQVIMNLLGNAVKFTPDWGSITFSVKQIVQEQGIGKYHFSVEDTGIGIARKNLHKIFDAFEQADDSIVNKYGGTGLGLSISCNLVRYMGGILKVESEEGKGSEFFFDLPFKINTNPEPEDLADDDVNKTEDVYDFTGKRVLLVEDNELNREIAIEILQQVGFEVDIAEDGKKAVMKYAEMEPFYYDVILMDIRMPVMNGLDATNHIRAMGKRDSATVPIFAMTANAFDDDMEKSLQTGMNGHLSKPIDVQKLYKTLKKQFRKQNEEI